MASELQILESDPDHVKGVFENLVLLVWRRHTLLGPYRLAIELVRRVATAHPKGFGVMQVVEVSAVPPDGDVRKAFGEMMRVPGIAHLSVTHEGSGFLAASLRAIVSGVHALARPAFAHSVQSSVADAARWAAAQNRAIGAPDAAAAIERAMQALRKLHVDKYP